MAILALAALPLIAAAQPNVDTALGGAAKAKVGRSAPAATVRVGEGGGIVSAGPAKDESFAIARGCNYRTGAPPVSDPGVCAAYSRWVNNALALVYERRRNASGQASDGSRLEIEITGLSDPQTLATLAAAGGSPDPKTHVFTLPQPLLALPDEKPQHLNGTTAYILTYAVEDGAPVIYAETLAFGSSEFVRRRYPVTSGQPLDIAMGFGDFVTVTPRVLPAA